MAYSPECLSLPAGERGLKFDMVHCHGPALSVAPRRGAWIEISLRFRLEKPTALSLPAGERGLKYRQLRM